MEKHKNTDPFNVLTGFSYTPEWPPKGLHPIKGFLTRAPQIHRPADLIYGPVFSRVDSETSTHDLCCKNFVKKNGSELTENLSEFSDCEFNLRYELLTPSDCDLYHQVFDPTQDDEAILASLADDIADI